MAQKLFDGDYRDCHLIEVEDDQVQHLKNLDESEVEKLIKANEVIHEFLYYDRKIKELNFNLQDLRDGLKKYKQQISDNKKFGIDSSEMDDIFVQINRLFINFITSLCNFADHLDEKRYGNKGAFKKVTAYLYDNYFSYRFFYNLRNYALHYSFPIDVIKRNYDPTLPESISELEVHFDKEKLLKDETFRKKKSMQQDLSGYNQTFPVDYLIDDIDKPLKILVDDFIQIEKVYFQDHANEIMRYANHASDPFKANIGKNNQQGSINTLILPVNSIERLRGRILSIDEAALPPLNCT